MRADWNDIDIDGIIDQTVWVCEYNTSFVNQMCKLAFLLFIYVYSFIVI